MKRKLTILLGLTLILGFAVSCKAALGTPTMGNKPKVLKPGEVPIQIKLGHLDKDGKPMDGFPSYRAVVPKEWDDTLKGNLTFKITGSDPSNAPISPIDNITWNEIKNGTASIILSKTGTYKLTMEARETVIGKVALKSNETNVGIGTTPVVAFVLYPNRDTAAPAGEIDLKIKFSNPARYGAGNNERLIKRLKVEIKGRGSSPQTISKTFGVGATDGGFTDISSADPAAGGEQSVSIIENTVKSDIYDVTIKAFKDTATAEQIGGVFGEMIIVDPLNTSQGVIELPTNLEDKPTAPANFKAQYKIDSQPDYLKSPNTGITTYSVEFTWDKTSINTEWFEIVLTPKNSSSTNPVITKGKTDLPASATSIIIANLVLGEKYTASIRACNNYGPSPETPYEDPKNAVTGAADLSTGKYGYLHLQKVVYHLQNEAFIIPAEGKNAAKMNTTDNGTDGQCTDYYTFRNTGFEFQLPGTTGMPRIGRYDNGTHKMWTFKGFYTSTDFNPATLSPQPSATAVTFIPDTELNLVEYYAYWVLDTSISVTFPGYENNFNIPGSNNPIVCPSSGGPFTKIRINFAGTITDLDVKWIIPEYTVPDTPETSSYSEFEVNPATISKTGGSTHLSDAKGLHQVLVTFKYKIGGIEKEGSTFCYIKVTD